MDVFQWTGRLTDASFQFLLAKQENSLGSSLWPKRRWGKGKMLTIGPHEPRLI